MLIRSYRRVLALCTVLLTLVLPWSTASQAALTEQATEVSFAWSATWGDVPRPGFGQATGIDFGPDGNVYISDAVRNDIQVFTPAGEPVRGFGSAGSEPGQFREPGDVATRGDKVYVADRSNARVQVLSPGGAPLAQIDGRQPLPGTAASRLPSRVVVDASGRVFVLNDDRGNLYRYSPQGGFEREYQEGCVAGSYQGIAVLSSGVVFCSYINGGVRRIPLEGAGTVIGDDTQPSPLGVIAHLAAAPDESVWAYRSRGYSSRPVVYALIHLSPDGAVLGQYPTTDDIVDIAASGDRIFALTAGRRVRVYDWAGRVLGEWGGDAFAGPNTYERPDRIAPAPDGSFYVLERARKRVRHVATDGRVLAVLTPSAGQGNLSKPIDMAVDALGRLYVLDLEFYPRIVRFVNERFDTVLAVLDTSPYMREPKAINVTGDTIVVVGFQPGSLAVYRMDLRGGRVAQAPVIAAAYQIGWFIDAALGTNDRLFALDANQGYPTVRAVDFYGNELGIWGRNNWTTDDSAFVLPMDIGADLRGRVFVVDTELHPVYNPPVRGSRVQVFDEDGVFLTQFGGYGSGQAQFVNPLGVAALADGRVVVADTNNNRLQVFAPSGDLPELQLLPKPRTDSNAGPIRPAGWQDFGPRGIGDFSAMIIPPQPSAERPIVGLYSGVSGRGAVALSTDGVAWRRQTGQPVPVVEQLLYAGRRTLIACGAYADAPYRSDDLGRTWLRLGDLPPNGPCSLVASPSYEQDRTLFIAAYENGVWRSTDAGATWQLRGGAGRALYDLVALPGEAGSRVLLTLPERGILRSTDDGATWQAVDSSSTTEIYVSPTFEHDHTLFATQPDYGTVGVRRSTDDGLTWTTVGAEAGGDWAALALSPAYATDKTVIVWARHTGKSILSKDGGNTWTEFTGSGAPTVRWMGFAPTYPTDAAIWRQQFDVPVGLEVTRDGGVTWQPLAAAPGTMVDGLAVGDSLAQPAWAATDYGMVSLPSSGSAPFLHRFSRNWNGRVDLALSPTFVTDGIAIGEGVITRDHGATWQDLVFAPELRWALTVGRSIEVVQFSPSYAEDGLILVAFDDFDDVTSDLRRSTDRGAKWQNLSLPVAGVRSLVFEPGAAAGRRVYAGGEWGVAMSNDGGETWTRAGLPLSLLKVTGLAARLEDGSPVVYAATSSDGVWRSTDGGQSWARFNTGLGDGYLCGLAGNESLLAAVTCAGQVYLWGGVTWERAGMPLAGSINDVVVQGTVGAGRLTVATSLGAFQAALPLGELRPLWVPLLRR